MNESRKVNQVLVKNIAAITIAPPTISAPQPR